MTALGDLIGQGKKVAAHRPRPRAVVNAKTWTLAAAALGQGRLTLLGLWGDKSFVHMALLDEEARDFAVLSLACKTGRFPSVGQTHPPAIRLERTIHDLYGLLPEGAPDMRPWLDHGQWPGRRKRAAADYSFLPAKGEHLHQIPVGPVHAGIIEPGHFRFTANGETVVRLEERLGYAHKGVEKLMEGADLDRAAKLAGRVSGDSTVAYAVAFARASEAALGFEAPPRAHYLRALIAELERLANHFGDIGAICNDASFALMHAHCGVLRERVLRAADAAFGHRLMMDRVVPGGTACDLDDAGAARIRDCLAEIKRTFPRLVGLYDNTASLQERTVSTGFVRPELAKQFGAPGFVGRGSGRAFDARKTPGYPPYDALEFTVPLLDSGDVNARVWIRIREVDQSVALIEQILDRLPQGPISIALDGAEGIAEGLGIAESFRGDVLAWIR